MKAHINVNAGSGLVQKVLGTAANAHDITQASELLSGDETDVFADSGYRGVHKREDVIKAHPQVNWHVAMMPSHRKALNKEVPMGAIMEALEKTKAQIRARVEHPCRVIKRQFGYVQARYRGLTKNTAQLHTLFALSNIWMVRRTLLKQMTG
jgi:IS5 family transposase